jgi:heme/copper-type cytochrome/quinol oxidase subunit 3
VTPVPPVVDVPPVVVRTNGRIPPPRPPTGGGDGPEGEPGPRRPLLDNALLGTLFLIGAEMMFFAGLVSAFWILRLSAPAWPPPLQPRLPVGITGLNTLVLLASSVAMAGAVLAVRRGDRRGTVRKLTIAAGLGTLFLLVQGYEWVRLVQFGLTLSSSTYGTTFYALIGTHAAHVLGALVWLGVMLLLVARGRLEPRRQALLRACGLYWHFVVALWPILYVTVYLL